MIRRLQLRGIEQLRAQRRRRAIRRSRRPSVQGVLRGQGQRQHRSRRTGHGGRRDVAAGVGRAVEGEKRATRAERTVAALLAVVSTHRRSDVRAPIICEPPFSCGGREERVSSAGELGTGTEQLVGLEPHGLRIGARRTRKERIDLTGATGWHATGSINSGGHRASIDRRDVSLPRIDDISAQREIFIHRPLYLDEEVVSIVFRHEIRQTGEIAEPVGCIVDDARAVVRVRKDQPGARLASRRAHARGSAIKAREVAATLSPVVGGGKRPGAGLQGVARRIVVGDHYGAFVRVEARHDARVRRAIPIPAEGGLQIALDARKVLPRDEVQDACHRVRAINRRRSVREDLNALDRERRGQPRVRGIGCRAGVARRLSTGSRHPSARAR